MLILFWVSIRGVFYNNIFAAESTTDINLSNDKITINGEEISTNSSEGIYLSSSMNNGGTSEDAKSANIEVSNIINITKAGTYEFTGELSDGQISVDSNDINGDVIIILNNVDITCKNAPAIFVYNRTITSTTCNVTIKTASGSTNTITGGKIKQNVDDWGNQDEILYYIDKDYDDDREYYERYKYDGAISSDISLIFEGDGTLIVNSTKKEGIESKQNITINSGNYEINSMDDGINACTDNESVITINGGTILINISEEAEEGDGIDSNGSIYINGGKVFAFASESSQDNGLDSDEGIYINGGYVVATGNMADEASKESSQNYLQLNFNQKISKNTLIAITDKNENPLVAFESDRDYTILTISIPELTDEDITVYEGGNIQGTAENGLYTDITSYTKGIEKEYSEVSEQEPMMGQFDNKNIMNEDLNNNIYYIVLGILTVLLIIFIIVAIVINKKGNKK